MPEAKLPGPFTIIADTLRRVVARPRLLLEAFIGFIFVYALYEVSAHLIGDLSGDKASIAAGFGVGVVYFVASLAVTFAILYAAVSPDGLNLGTALARMGSYWLPLFVLVVLFYLVLVTTSIFLIVPALLFTLYSTFVFIVAIKEDQRGLMAFVRSADLVEGSFWQLIGRFILFVLSLLVLLLPIFIAVTAVSVWVTTNESLYVQAIFLLVMALYGSIITVLTMQFHIALYEAFLLRKPLATFQPEQYAVLRTLYQIAAWIAVPLIVLFGGAIGYLAAEEAKLAAYCDNTENEANEEYYDKCYDYLYGYDDWDSEYDWYDDPYDADDDWYNEEYIGENGYDYYDGWPQELSITSEASRETAVAGDEVTFTFTVTNTDDIEHTLYSLDISRYLYNVLTGLTYEPAPYDVGEYYSNTLYYEEDIAPGEAFVFSLTGVLREPMSIVAAGELEQSYVTFCVFDEYTCEYEAVYTPAPGN